MDNCLFCKIARKEIPSKILYEDDLSLAFEDINPEAPVHFLVIPKEHISSLKEMEESHKDLMGHLVHVASKLAKDKDLDDGYRLVNNCGSDGGQTVDHLHFHVLGKRKMLWPPG